MGEDRVESSRSQRCGRRVRAFHAACWSNHAAPPERLWARADEDKAGGADGLGEVGVLGQEPVAGVDRVGAGLLRGADVLLRVEIAADLDRLARGARVKRPTVVRSDDGDGLDAQLVARAEDPQRYLAAVRYEELLDGQSRTNVIRQAPERSR